MTDRIQKRVLLFSHDSSLYGASLSLLTLLEFISKYTSYEILIILPYGGLIEDRFSNFKINYKIVHFPRCVANKTNSIIFNFIKIIGYLGHEIKVLPKLLYIVAQFKPNIVYTNTSVVSIGYKIAKIFRIPHIWHIREFSDFYNYQYLPSRNLVSRKIIRSDKVIFTSKILRTHWVHSEKEKYHVVYNGVEFKKIVESPKRSYFYKFGLLGGIIPGKGQDIAIKAFSKLIKKYKYSELHFFGDILDQNYFNHLKNLIEELNCQGYVKFHPFISDNKLIYSNLNILLSCSINEGFGKTIIEAMSYGIPVIANASGGPIEIINDGIDGLLYEVTPESLFEKMFKLLSDINLFENISKNARAKAVNEFPVQKYIAGVINVFNEVLKKN